MNKVILFGLCFTFACSLNSFAGTRMLDACKWDHSEGTTREKAGRKKHRDLNNLKRYERSASLRPSRIHTKNTVHVSRTVHREQYDA